MVNLVSIKYELEIVSKNKRIFGIFKPSGVIQGESFDIKLIFKNESEEDFYGGSVTPVLYSPEIDIGHELKVIKIPQIDRGRQKTITMKNLKTLKSGIHGIQFSNQESIVSNKIRRFGVFIVDSDGKPMEERSFESFYVTGREELYAKYEVIVALGASIIASITSIIAIIIAVLTL